MINDVNNLLLTKGEGCRYKGKTPTILCNVISEIANDKKERKYLLVKTVIRKNISERMLKTMKKPNAPREGCRCKGKNPKTFSYLVSSLKSL